jgi:hypothetical protein
LKLKYNNGGKDTITLTANGYVSLPDILGVKYVCFPIPVW